MNRKCLIILISFFCYGAAVAQEYVAPLQVNPVLRMSRKQPMLKTTTLTLPFFEDFTGYDPIPDIARWTDRSVYINNTMAQNPISRGVATFDALNAQGAPYDSTNPNNYRYADSLTSQPLDLSNRQPSDSIYLSFFYQPQGNGFAPETQDSLLLFFRTSTSKWNRVWAQEGTTVQPFRQVMIGITDTSYLHAGFQFRFVNKASININDDVWNLDYIRLNANRNLYDTTVQDLVTTLPPSNLLNDYTSMPYRQFVNNMSSELATDHSFSVANHYFFSQTINYGYSARETTTGSILSPWISNSDNVAGFTSKKYQFPLYTIGFSAGGPQAKVVFENKYFARIPTTVEPTENDTIVHQQVFDNYLAYDDGTAEKSYFLHQSNTLPAKIAVEFHLNQPDTLRGLAIYFGRQSPLAFSKYFSIAVYNNLTLGSIFDTVRYQQDLYSPAYVDTINHFWIYRFDSALAMNAGTFYIGTIQPAQSGSDSLYFGLDVNRQGGNHLYFNANGYWESSIISGALMIRPILGEYVAGTPVAPDPEALSWDLFPNPARHSLTLAVAGGTRYIYQLTDLDGRVLRSGEARGQKEVDIAALTPGVYLVRIFTEERAGTPKKFIKL